MNAPRGLCVPARPWFAVTTGGREIKDGTRASPTWQLSRARARATGPAWAASCDAGRTHWLWRASTRAGWCRSPNSLGSAWPRLGSADRTTRSASPGDLPTGVPAARAGEPVRGVVEYPQAPRPEVHRRPGHERAAAPHAVLAALLALRQGSDARQLHRRQIFRLRGHDQDGRRQDCAPADGLRRIARELIKIPGIAQELLSDARTRPMSRWAWAPVTADSDSHSQARSYTSIESVSDSHISVPMVSTMTRRRS